MGQKLFFWLNNYPSQLGEQLHGVMIFSVHVNLVNWCNMQNKHVQIRACV